MIVRQHQITRLTGTLLQSRNLHRSRFKVKLRFQISYRHISYYTNMPYYDYDNKICCTSHNMITVAVLLLTPLLSNRWQFWYFIEGAGSWFVVWF